MTWLPKAPVNRVRSAVFDDDFAELHYALHPIERICKADVRRILVRTTAAGPFDEDIFYIFETERATYTVPNGALGSDFVLVWGKSLLDFDNETFIQAMSCTENRDFICWERDESGIEPHPS